MKYRYLGRSGFKVPVLGFGAGTFGGQGPHYCLGANLAKMQLELIFNAVADYFPDLTALGDPTRLRSGWLNGLTEWKVDLGKCPVVH